MDASVEKKKTVDAGIHYPGVLSCNLCAEIFLARLIPIIPVSVRVTLKRLTGDLRILIKKPPSQRIWLGFHERPKVELEFSPQLGAQGVDLQVLLRFLEKLVLEVIDEVMVLPSMEDFWVPVM
ncbi:hypothetical protein H696_06204 [Fonticula alba]|uniref:SMP-LTD domain-containing protein n=1 Tax=Fonticula alba TaxID=691883 RepID=A0A058Z0A4_FONAL|nr:hypothetical protein H696_06204 [Fonticula alba]KCV67368.1 hypothetical protein H696_06204 [Fonticula alba]|eukprot:XP_009498224.1 hypothetical protein H696_06204 [Fonticula alba]